MLKQRLLECGFEDGEALDAYVKLIEASQFQSKELYRTAVHHIIPRCYFKLKKNIIDNSDANLVNLTHLDHLKAHYYLALAAQESKLKSKLISAFYLLLDAPGGNLKEFDPTQLDYYQELLEGRMQHSAVAKEVICVETQTQYPSVAQAARELGCEESSIHRCLQGYLNKAGGYHGALVADKVRQQQLQQYVGKDPQVGKERPVYCAELDQVFPSGKEASRQLGILLSSINDCCLGKQKKAGGYHGAYNENREQVKAYIKQAPTYIKERPVRCITTGEIFASIKEAAQAKQVSNYGGITCCCRGLQKSAGGFQGQYV